MSVVRETTLHPVEWSLETEHIDDVSGEAGTNQEIQEIHQVITSFETHIITYCAYALVTSTSADAASIPPTQVGP